MGLSSTINREMAKFSTQINKNQEMRNLARTLEIIYWIMALAIGLTVIAFSPLISNYWLKSNSLSPETVKSAIIIMGLVIVVRWPHAFYAGGLMGLQKQFVLNILKVGIETLRNVGVILILWLYSPTILAFLGWQIIMYSINIAIIAWLFWRAIPPSEHKPVFSFQSIKEIWRFAAGMTGMTLLTTLLTQLDKIILSKMLPLKEFGYYMLASSLAMGLGLLISPIYSAVFPKLTQLATLGDEKQVAKVYHAGCQVMAIVVLPISLEMAFFSKEILLLWTHSPETAENSFRILSVLIIGTGLNGLLNMPAALQLAYGWTSLGVYANTVAVIVLVPLLIVMTLHFGAIGAAFAWFLLNFGYFLFTVYLLHRKILKGHLMQWYVEDVGKPAAIVLLVVIFFRQFLPNMLELSSFGKLIGLGCIYVVSLLLCTMTFKSARDWLMMRFQGRSI
jgi:O-antigen/teichoic acid export membrane protein